MKDPIDLLASLIGMVQAHLERDPVAVKVNDQITSIAKAFLEVVRKSPSNHSSTCN